MLGLVKELYSIADPFVMKPFAYIATFVALTLFVLGLFPFLIKASGMPVNQDWIAPGLTLAGVSLVGLGTWFLPRLMNIPSNFGELVVRAKAFDKTLDTVAALETEVERLVKQIKFLTPDDARQTVGSFLAAEQKLSKLLKESDPRVQDRLRKILSTLRAASVGLVQVVDDERLKQVLTDLQDIAPDIEKFHSKSA